MNEEKFTGKADNYDKYRLSYPDRLIDWLYDMTGAEKVADIGAGTGKFTACLLKKPWQVTAVEPNPDMSAKLRGNFPELEIVSASAENTGLPAHSFGLVTTAQAFHWFDEEKFREECRRIFNDEGRLAIVFNSVCKEGISAKRDRICEKFCSGFAGRNGHVGRRSAEEGDSFLSNEYFTSVEIFETESRVLMTRERFIGDTLSRSYALTENDSGYADFLKALNRAFDEYAQNGQVTVPYKTTCYLGRF